METTIGELFIVEYGQKEFHSKEHLQGEEGNNILISSKGEDNGIYGFFNIETKYENVISVPSTGTIGQAFVQNKKCCIDDNCLVLIPKKEMTFEELYQVAFQIRNNKYRYRYGRQLTPKRLEEQKIRVENLKTSYQELEKERLPKENKKEKIIENKNFKCFKIKELCEIKKDNALPQNALNFDEKAKIPYVTTTSLNNGVSLFCDEETNFKGKCLSVALNGSCGETFYQLNEFVSNGDVGVLHLRKEYENKYFLFYIGTLIKKEKWRYNYYNKYNKTKLENTQIPIPMKNNEIDFVYIEKIVKNAYGFNVLKKDI